MLSTHPHPKKERPFFSPRVWPLMVLFLAIGIFFWEMVFLKASFLSGDHRAQHYPWAAFYADQIKQFCLPWWTTYFHCGFPLLAEGQVGAFYPLNFIFYYFLPLFPAYTYNILFHYLLSALFCYGFLRALKVSEWAALFGTLIYLFGTAQGGYYYNIISLKVLIWFPLALWLSYRILEKKVYGETTWLAVIFALQFFAGYLQYAVYSVGFTVFFYLWLSIAQWRATSNGKEFFAQIGLLLAALCLSFLIALPQLGSTFELSLLSNRYQFPEEFAYVGSLNPLTITTLFFPQWDGFLCAELYMGAIGLFFLMVSLLTPKNREERFFIWLVLLSVFLALGQFNPFYVLFVKWTHVTSLRVPTKFLYFSAFGGAVLCAYGFQKWQEGKVLLQRAHRLFQAISGVAVGGLVVATPMLRVFEPAIKSLGRQYLEKNFTNSVVHQQPLEVYFDRWNAYFEEVLRNLSLSDRWNLVFCGFVVAAMVIVFLLKKKQWCVSLTSKVVLLTFLFVNLYAYSWVSLKGSYRSPESVQRSSKIVDRLKKESGMFRIHRYYTDIHQADTLPVVPHVNLMDSLSIIGGYSPLVVAEYYDLLEGVGDIDDSNKLRTASREGILSKKSFLDFLNVRFLVSDQKLSDLPFRLLEEENGYFLYENTQSMPRAFLVGQSQDIDFQSFASMIRSGKFNPRRWVYLMQKNEGGSMPLAVKDYYHPVEILEDRDAIARFKFRSERPVYMVMSDLYYPGWKAYKNGVEVPMLKANGAFRAIALSEPGSYDIELRYEPIWKKFVVPSAVLLVFCMLMPLGQRGWRSNGFQKRAV